VAFRRVQPRDEDAIRAYLTRREERCVSLCELVRQALGRQGDTQGVEAWAYFRPGTRGVGAVLALSKYRSLAVAIDEGPDDGSIAEVLSQILVGAEKIDHPRANGLRGRLLAAMQGQREEVEIVQRAYGTLLPGIKIGESIDFVSMAATLDGEPSSSDHSQIGPRGLRIRRASSDDENGIFPLQVAYELEEVVPPSGRHDRGACRLALAKALKERIILVAELQGRPVGKAGINASGWLWDQMGGVYVSPESRGRGIGTRLALELRDLTFERRRSLALFVRPSNHAALRAYDQADFKRGGAYRIAYYGN